MDKLVETGSTSACGGNPDSPSSVLFSQQVWKPSSSLLCLISSLVVTECAGAQLGSAGWLFSGCNFRPGCPACACACDSWAVLVSLSSQGRHSKHLLAVKPPWLLAEETQSCRLKAEGAVQSPTVTSGSIRRGEGEERMCQRPGGFYYETLSKHKFFSHH